MLMVLIPHYSPGKSPLVIVNPPHFWLSPLLVDSIPIPGTSERILLVKQRISPHLQHFFIMFSGEHLYGMLKKHPPVKPQRNGWQQTIKLFPNGWW